MLTASGGIRRRAQQTALVPVVLRLDTRRVDGAEEAPGGIAFEPGLAVVGAESGHAAVFVPDHLDVLAGDSVGRRIDPSQHRSR